MRSEGQKFVLDGHVWKIAFCLLGLIVFGRNQASVHGQANTSISNRSERVSFMLGDPSQGETLGLDGVLYGVGSETRGYNRWDLVLKNSDGSPIAADLSLQLILEIRSGDSSYSVTVPVEIKAGSPESRTSFFVPFGEQSTQVGMWGWAMNYRVRITRDGYPLQGLSAEEKNRPSKATNLGNNLSNLPEHSLLLLSDKTVQTRNNGDWSQMVTLNYRGTANTATYNAEGFLAADWPVLLASNEWLHPKFGLAVVDRLPTNWLEFSVRENIVVSMQDFASLNEAQRNAILDYVLAGGSFVVAGMTSKTGFDESLQAWLDKVAPKELQLAPIKKEVGGTSGPFSAQTIQVGFGSIVLASTNVSSYQGIIFGQPLATVASSSSRTISDRAASNVMEWYIPRVGQPPVIGFSVFICAFALFAGPILLWFAHYRLQRPVLLLIIFPPLALLIAASILFYSILKDGFDTHARVRSVTWVNQATTRGISHSRQTYFSGMPPRTISFSPRSEVWPTVEVNSRRRNARSNTNIGLSWSDESQAYTGFLSPRTQCQWTVTTPLDSLKTFDYVANPKSPEPMALATGVDSTTVGPIAPEASAYGSGKTTASSGQSNPLSGKLTKLQNIMQDDWIFGIFCDRDSTLHRVGPTAAGKQAVLSDIRSEDALTELRKLTRPLAFPPGYPVSGTPSIGYWMMNQDSVDYSSIFESSDTGMEKKLTQWLSGENFLKPGGFLLLLRSASYLDQPLRETVRESDSFHVLTGTW